MKKIVLTMICVLNLVLAAEDRISQAQAIDTLEQGLAVLDQWNHDLHQNPLALGIAYHQLAFWDSEYYGPLGLEVLESLDGPEAMAYRGSLITILSALEENRRPLKALAMLREGAELIDQAVLLDQQDISLRLLRLENGIEVSLSSPYKRYDRMAEDEEPILSWIHNGGPDSETKESCYWYYLGELAMGLSEWDKALDYMYRATETAPGSIWAFKAEDQLFLLEE